MSFTSNPYQNRLQRNDASIDATHMHLPRKNHTTSLHVTTSHAVGTIGGQDSEYGSNAKGLLGSMHTFISTIFSFFAEPR